MASAPFVLVWRYVLSFLIRHAIAHQGPVPPTDRRQGTPVLALNRLAAAVERQACQRTDGTVSHESAGGLSMPLRTGGQSALKQRRPTTNNSSEPEVAKHAHGSWCLKTLCGLGSYCTQTVCHSLHTGIVEPDMLSNTASN